MMRIILVCLVVFALGCGASMKSEVLALESLPEGVLKKAQEALPNVTFDQAIRRSDGGYEVRGKDATGKIRDVEFSSSGSVIEIE